MLFLKPQGLFKFCITVQCNELLCIFLAQTLHNLKKELLKVKFSDF